MRRTFASMMTEMCMNMMMCMLFMDKRRSPGNPECGFVKRDAKMAACFFVC